MLKRWGNNENRSANCNAAFLKTFVSLNMEIMWEFSMSQNFSFRMDMNEVVLSGGTEITVNERRSN